MNLLLVGWKIKILLAICVEYTCSNSNSNSTCDFVKK